MLDYLQVRFLPPPLFRRARFPTSYPKGQSNLARADVGHVRDRSCGGLGNSQPRMQIQLRNETATRQELNDGLVVRYEVTAGRDRHFSIPFEV